MIARPIQEQICLTKNMVKTFGTLFKNVPEYVEELRECRLVIGEYEIFWLKNAPLEFTVYVGCVIPSSYWEPESYDSIELGTFETLYEAVLFVAKHSVEQVFQQYMEGEAEYQLDMEIRDSYNQLHCQRAIQHG
jgi:hypothetical protein